MDRPVVIIDIDGTVSDARHRLHLIAGESDRERWGSFFDAAGADPPIPEGIGLARQLAEQCDLFWITGRPERTRALTLRWLAAHELPVGRLLMYPPGERRPTREVKLDRVRAISRERRVALVVDDDPRVIASLRELGIPVLLATGVPWSDPIQPAPQVGPGSGSEPLCHPDHASDQMI